ncbi:MAG: hypothetical protein AAFW83_10435 [Pseudomonadota bacterium]
MSDPLRKEHRELTEKEKNDISFIKQLAEDLLNAIEETGSGREQSIAKTNIEQAVMWAVKGATA